MTHDHIEEILQRGIAFHGNKQFIEAESCYKEALAIDPSNADAVHLLGLLADAIGDKELAIELIRTAISKNPSSAVFHNNLGNIHKSRGEQDLAIACYLQALKINPDYADAHFNLANLYRDQDRLIQAVPLYQKATKLNPDLAIAWINLSDALRQLDQIEEAIDSLTHYLELKPGDLYGKSQLANLYYELGVEMESQDKKEDALACFEKALSVVPTHVASRGKLSALTAPQPPATTPGAPLAPLQAAGTETVSPMSGTANISERTAERMAIYVGNNRALTRTIYGHKMFVDTRDLSLAPHILLDGYWEKWITNVFLEQVRPGMNVVDIGANVGFYSILAAHNIGQYGHLTCFEANPELADIVLNNLHINGLADRSVVVNKAAYSESTTLEFKIYHKFLGSSSLWADENYAESLGDHLTILKVDAVTLDDYFAEGQRIDFLKIDAEGAEPHILKGAQRILRENKNLRIMMEFSPGMLRAAYGSVEQFCGEIHELGFKIFRINPDSKLQELSLSEAVATSHCDVLLVR